jgi:tRNA-dihydrouridine synthase
MMRKTGCDGVMVGRAAIGNPFIFRQLNEYFGNGSYSVPTAEERIGMLGRFLRYSKDDSLSSVRLQAVQLILGIGNRAEIRRRMASARSISDISAVAESLGSKPK